MLKTNKTITVPNDLIENKIFFIRGKKVMIDRDLAELYGVETRVLNQAVKRNIKRFPDDFMFQLNKQEMKIWESFFLRSQIVILENKRGKYKKYLPYCFTEQGVAMLSSVLKSERAMRVNIQIMRTFTKLREMIATNQELREKIEKLEGKYDKRFKIIFDTMRKLLDDKKEAEIEPPGKIGFVDRSKK